MNEDGSRESQIERAGAVSKFFVTRRSIAWFLVLASIAAGVWGYISAPKRSQPRVVTGVGVAVCEWPGAAAADVERLVTQRIEQAIHHAARLQKSHPNHPRISSTSVDGRSEVTIYVDVEGRSGTAALLRDVKLALTEVPGLPEGAGPVRFEVRSAGDVPLSLVIASPERSRAENRVYARMIRQAIERARSDGGVNDIGQRSTLLVLDSAKLSPIAAGRVRDGIFSLLRERDALQEPVEISGPGFLGIDGRFSLPPHELERLANEVSQRLMGAGLGPRSTWNVSVLSDPSELEALLESHSVGRYGFDELSEQARLIAERLRTLPVTTRVDVVPDFDDAIYLETNAAKLALLGVSVTSIAAAVQQRVRVRPVGQIKSDGNVVTVRSPARTVTPEALGETIVGFSKEGVPVYLRDVATVSLKRDVSVPRRTYYTRTGESGHERLRAVSLNVHAHLDADLGEFAAAVLELVDSLHVQLPDDAIIEPLYNHATEVAQSMNELRVAFGEALVLVLFFALVGFRGLRAALVITLSVVVTVAMTLAVIRLFGIELQEISLVALIVSLGLLVDDPVVALSAVQSEMRAGAPLKRAAWLGPTRLRRPIVFATLANIAAYFPVLFVGGTLGAFLHALPVVITAALVCSRIVSVTVVPMLATYLKPGSARRTVAASARDPHLARWTKQAFRYRKRVALGALVLGVCGVMLGGALKSGMERGGGFRVVYADVEVQPNATIEETDVVTEHVVRALREAIRQEDGSEDALLSLTEFVGTPGPRIWFSLVPFADSPNLARLILMLRDADDVDRLLPVMQKAVSEQVPGAVVDLGKFSLVLLQYPLSVVVSGPGNREYLMEKAREVQALLSSAPNVERVRNNWGAPQFSVSLGVDGARANFFGVSGRAVAETVAAGVDGSYLGRVPLGEREAAVILTLEPSQRDEPNDVRALGVRAKAGNWTVPVAAVAELSKGVSPKRIRRRNLTESVSVFGYPAPGVLASEALDPLLPRLRAIAADLPSGFEIQVEGEHALRAEGTTEIRKVMLISVALIYFMLVFAFRSVLKPFIVFAAVPFGVAGAVLGLLVMDQALGTMGYLAIMSLSGIIVSHVVVLFGAIESEANPGVTLEERLVHAVKLRAAPVLITVCAVAAALLPLAFGAGTLWRPFAFAQMGGLALALVAELLLVPVLYGILAQDLGWIRRGSRAAVKPE